MAGQIGITHPCEEKREKWTQYVERLEHFFAANGHTGTGKQKSFLLTAIGPTAYQLLSNLINPDKPGDKTYSQLVEITKAHHSPTPSEIGQNFKFSHRDRQT